MSKHTEQERLELRQDGHILVIVDAPPPRNRLERGIREVMKRTRLIADVTGSWAQMRAWSAEVGLLVDPLDDPRNKRTEDLAERYRNPVARMLERR